MKLEWSLEKKDSASRGAMVVLLAVLMAGAGCSKATPVAASKAPVTVDPDLFSVERPELFKSAKAGNAGASRLN